MTKSIPFSDLALQQKRLNNIIRSKISKVLSHGKYIMGPEVLELEKKLEVYTNAKNAITCASGTDALLLSMLAYNIGPGDAVFCPSFTFPATAEAIALVGATPVFVDVDNDLFNISIDDLKKNIDLVKKNKKIKTKAILAVDLYGLPADYLGLKKIASEHDMLLIADSAQSFGAEYFNKKVGSLADITCVSFFPSKPLGCYGDGGAIFCNNTLIANRLKSLRSHGKGKAKYEIDYVGLNSRLDTIQAAILLAKLEEFEWEIKMRNKIANRYSSSFSQFIDTPIVPEGVKSSWAQYTIKIKNRDNIQSELEKQGIVTMVYYPFPMHLQPAYKKFNLESSNFPISETLSKEVLSIPIYPDMIESDQEYIIDSLLKAL